MRTHIVYTKKYHRNEDNLLHMNFKEQPGVIVKVHKMTNYFTE